MGDPATTDGSLERTYRYLRLAIAGTVLVIAIGTVSATVTDGLLGSISAYYYSPARNALVGALFVVGIGMLALSGRGAPRALLDAAALFAPLIAIIPTPVGPDEIPGLQVDCDPRPRCVPSIVDADLQNGIHVYLGFGAVAFLAAAIIAILGARRRGTRVSGGVIGSLASSGLLLLVLLLAWVLVPDVVVATGHVVATIAFFLLVATIVVGNAIPRLAHVWRDPGEAAPPTWMAISYGIIGVALAVDLALFGVAIGTGWFEGAAIPSVFLIEFVALGLFAAFWVLQTAQHRSSPDPSRRVGGTA
jgi:hypothetical protein